MPTNSIDIDLCAKQAAAYLQAVAHGLALALRPIEALANLPSENDITQGATHRRVAYLAALVLIVDNAADLDAAEVVDGPLPRASNIRPATSGEQEGLADLAVAVDQALAMAAPRKLRVLSHVPPLAGRSLEALEGRAARLDRFTGRGVEALIPREPSEGGAA